MTIILYGILGVALLIGLWGLASLAAALKKSGSPAKLFRAWLTALTGR